MKLSSMSQTPDSTYLAEEERVMIIKKNCQLAVELTQARAMLDKGVMLAEAGHDCGALCRPPLI